MAETITIRVYTADWLRLGRLQAERAQATRVRPAFADLISEALDRLEES